MTDSLIKTILLQADNSNARLEDLKLALLAQESEIGGYFSKKEMIGGFGAANIKDILPLLTLIGEKITAIADEEKLATHAEKIKNADKRSAYQAGLCYALIAVYGKNIKNRIKAYEELAKLYAPDGLLKDTELQNRCTQMVHPLLTKGEFYPLSRILFTWEMTGKDEVLKFEMQRQTELKISKPITIEQSLRVLGLKADELTEDKIRTAQEIAKQRLMNISGLKDKDTVDNPLFNNFADASAKLSLFMRFKQFNSKASLTSLAAVINKAKKAAFSDAGTFSEVNKGFIALQQQLEELIEISQSGESSHIIGGMITERLGFFLEQRNRYGLELDFEARVNDYWNNNVINKVDLLLNQVEPSLKALAAYSLGSAPQLSDQLKAAITVVTEIETSAASRFLNAATNVADKNKALKSQLQKLQEGISQYEAHIQTNVKNAIVLHTRLVSASPDVKVDEDVNSFIRLRQGLKQEAAAQLALWKAMDKAAKQRVEQEFAKSSFALTYQSIIQKLDSGKDLDAAIKKAADNFNKSLRESLSEIIKEFAELSQLIEQIQQEENNLEYSWQNNMVALLKMQQDLNANLAAVMKKVPENYSTVDYLEKDVVDSITRLKTDEKTFSSKLSKMKRSLGEAGIDVLNFTTLYARIRDEKSKYLKQGAHHEERVKSLKRLEDECLRIAGLKGNRFSELESVLQTEHDTTTKHHQQIGFLASQRPCRLQKTYASLLDEAKKLRVLAPQPAVWETATLSLDSLKYMRLKALIRQESGAYLGKGKHHQDRQASLKRLDEKIALLDNAEGQMDERFDDLLQTVHDEIKRTKESHLRVGFFPSWHHCELQKVYGRIIDEAAKLKDVAVPKPAASMVM